LWRSNSFYSEVLSLSAETVRSDGSLIVDGAHWLVSGVAWKLDLVVLDNVLFHDCVSVAGESGLSDSKWVEVSLGDETIVAWDVSGGLGRTHAQLVVLVVHSRRVSVELVSGVLAVGAE